MNNSFPESIYTDDGIHVDFVSGVRIGVPPGTKPFRFKLSNAHTGEIYEYGDAAGEDQEFFIFSRLKYFIPWKVELYRNGKWFFEHTFDATGRNVFIDLSPAAIGDSVAWIPAAIAFAKKWKCHTTICMRENHVPLYKDAYPEITFIANDNKKADIASRCYAYYRVAVFGYGDTDHELIDFRHNNLIRHADMILGVDSGMIPPLVVGEAEPKPNYPEYLADKPKYVCIATRASRKCKEWNCPGGWDRVSTAIIERGFIPVVIDADNRNLPDGAFDNTGNIPLSSRIDVLKGAQFFIGLPSGLSWLAWACRIPVVMISGFTDSYVEFDTPYRVSPPPGICHGCWRDGDQRQRKRFDECFYEKSNECTRSITPEMVISVIDKLIQEGAL